MFVDAYIVLRAKIRSEGDKYQFSASEILITREIHYTVINNWGISKQGIYQLKRYAVISLLVSCQRKWQMTKKIFFSTNTNIVKSCYISMMYGLFTILTPSCESSTYQGFFFNDFLFNYNLKNNYYGDASCVVSLVVTLAQALASCETPFAVNFHQAHCALYNVFRFTLILALASWIMPFVLILKRLFCIITSKMIKFFFLLFCLSYRTVINEL